MLKKYGHKFFESAVDMFCIADANGYFLDLNHSWTKVLGWSKEELTAIPYKEFIHPDDLLPTIETASRLTAGEPAINFRNRYKVKSGGYKWLNWRANIDRETNLIFAVAADISEQLAEQALVDKAKEVARIGSWRVDVVNQTCKWSKITYEIHEVEEGTPIKLEDGINFYVPEHRDIIATRVQDAIEHNKSWDLHLQIVTTSGRRVWIRAIGWPVIEDGQLRWLEGVFQDIDDQKRQAELVKKSNQTLAKFEYALNAHAIVARTDAKGLIKYANDQFIKISGYSHDELIGKDHRIINSGYHPKEFFKELWSVIKSGKTWRGEICNKAKDGRLYWVDTAITPITNSQGHPVEFVAIRSDITQRKHFEEQLELERKKSLAANRAKSQFLASMSHEIRTPMNGVIGMTEMLLQEQEDEEQIEKLKIIKQCGEHLINLINDILDYSKVEAGKMEIENEVFDLPELLNQTIQLFTPKAEEKRIKLEAVLSHLPQAISADKRKIGQVLFNLIGNAIKFTHSGGVTLTVSCIDKGILEFQVIDSGQGIPESIQNSLFSPFVQGKHDESIKGTGLGLAICKELLLRLGGDICFTSIPGAGATFTFQVPFDEVDVPHALPPKPKKLSTDIRLFNNLRVLVAEDNDVNRLVVKEMLKKLGIQPTIVTNGLEVVSAFEQEEFDIIFMDVHMPKLDGLEATQRIRKINKSVPIVALTAGAFEEDRQSCLKAGMNDFITKPVKIVKILEVLSLFFAQNPTRQVS